MMRLWMTLAWLLAFTSPVAAQIVGQGAAGTDPWLITGPLTDAQLRATPVPISGTVTFSNTSIDITDRAARLLGVVFGSQGQQIKQTGVNFNLAAELFSGGTVVALPTTLGGAGGFKVEVLSGAGGEPSGCGSTNFETNAAMPSTDTVVTATATCVSWIYIANIGTQSTTVTIKDNAGTPFTYANAVFIPANSTAEWHPNGKIFTGGIRVQAGAASVINYAIKGKQ